MTLAHAQGMPLGKDSLSDNRISVTVKTNAMVLGMLIANAGVELGFGDRFSLHIPFYYSGVNYFSSHTKFRILGTQPEFRYWTPQCGTKLLWRLLLRVARYCEGSDFGEPYGYWASRWRFGGPYGLWYG